MAISTPWIKNLKKGDVVKSPGGVLRVVRSIKRWGNSDSKTRVSFSILRCSWTKRPTTTLTGTDLRVQGYSPTKAKYNLNSKLDRQIEKDMFGRNGKSLLGKEREIFCCDVVNWIT